MYFRLKLKSTDIVEFCECCTQLKRDGIHIEVGQENKTICGSSLIGLSILDFDKPIYIISHDKISDKELSLFKKWSLEKTGSRK